MEKHVICHKHDSNYLSILKPDKVFAHAYKKYISLIILDAKTRSDEVFIFRPFYHRHVAKSYTNLSQVKFKSKFP